MEVPKFSVSNGTKIPEFGTPCVFIIFLIPCGVRIFFAIKYLFVTFYCMELYRVDVIGYMSYI